MGADCYFDGLNLNGKADRAKRIKKVICRTRKMPTFIFIIQGRSCDAQLFQQTKSRDDCRFCVPSRTVIAYIVSDEGEQKVYFKALTLSIGFDKALECYSCHLWCYPIPLMCYRLLMQSQAAAMVIIRSYLLSNFLFQKCLSNFHSMNFSAAKNWTSCAI